MKNVLVGLVLGLAIGFGAAYIRISRLDARVAALNAKADSLADEQALDSAIVDSSKVAQAGHDSTADKASRRAERIRLGAVAQRLPAPCITPGAPAAATVVMVPLDTALAWKYAWEAERTARLHATKVLIPDLERLIATQNARIGVLEQGIHLRDQKIRGLEWRNRIMPIGIGVGALIVFAVVSLR